MWRFYENYIKNKKKACLMVKKKKKNKVNFIEIRTIQNIFTYKNYPFITFLSKVAFVIKSKP